MNKEYRLYAHLFIQLSVVVLLLLYVMLTAEAYPANWLWFTIAIVLGVIGYVRTLREAVVVSIFALLGYGLRVGYLLYWTPFTLHEAGWNDVVWLLALPLAAITGTLHPLHTDQELQAARQLAYERKRLAMEVAASQEVMPLDETSGIADRETFHKQLHISIRELLDSDRQETQSLVLMIVQLQYYWEEKESYGFDRTLRMLNMLAELINDTIPSTLTKGYIGGGAFAVLFPVSETFSAVYAEISLKVKYNDMLLRIPRSEGFSRSRLRFGIARFPEQTTDSEALLFRAKQELDRNLRPL